MTKNNKIVVTKYNNKYILIHIVNDKACKIFAYDSIVDDFPIGTIVNAVVEKKLKNIDSCFVRYTPKESGYLDKSYKCESIIPVMYKKEQIGTKHAKFTDVLSITSDYVIVFSDGPYTKASRQLSDTKAKELLERYGHYSCDYSVGLLFRTACGNSDIDEQVIEDDIVTSCEKLHSIINNSEHRVAYSVLYRPVPQIIQDCLELDRDGSNELITDCDELIKALEIDNRRVKTFTDRVDIRKYQDNLLPLCKLYAFESKISEATSRLVYLKSGANITFDKTEALTAIDVNSSRAKFEEGHEEGALKVNIEAAVEIARQLVLRNISGIIIVDFISMKNRSSYAKLIDVINNELKNDNCNCNFHGFTSLGLAEISRQKIRSPLVEQLR